MALTPKTTMPNLEFLNAKLSEIDSKISAANSRIISYNQQALAWQKEAQRLKSLQDGYDFASKKEAIQPEINNAVSKMNYYNTLSANETTAINTLKSDRALILTAIQDYQAAVAVNLASGGTDAGSTAVAEQQMNLVAQAYKDEQAQKEAEAKKIEDAKRIRNIIIAIIVAAIIAAIIYFIVKAKNKNKK